MKLILYNNASDDRVVGKDLTQLSILDAVVIKENTNIIKPTITFHKSHAEDWEYCNYCKLVGKKFHTQSIEGFNPVPRCYFIRNFNIAPGGIIELECEIDVLETYKQNIRGLKTLVTRQENTFNPALNDPLMVIPNNRKIYTHKVDGAVNIGGSDVSSHGVVGDGGDGSIILTVSGGRG